MAWRLIKLRVNFTLEAVQVRFLYRQGVNHPQLGLEEMVSSGHLSVQGVSNRALQI
jgi:hypothetical protein